jgi:hypothetical protein
MNANSHAIYGGIVRVMETKNKLGGPTWGDGDLHEDATIPDRVPSNPPLGQEDQPSSKDKRGPLVTCDEGVEKAELKGLICKEFAA